MIYSINPATEEVIGTFEPGSPERIEEVLSRAAETFRTWRKTAFAERTRLLHGAGSYLRSNKQDLAEVITSEMGKPLTEAEGEIEKCAWNCDHYADHGEEYLRDEAKVTSAGESYVSFLPIGPVLAIMPWNFPFWQVFRFAAPALMAGNTAVLKHASNVTRCSLAIEAVFRETGFPDGCFQSLVLPGSAVPEIIRDPRIAAVTLTGSEGAGAEVASVSGAALKKTVLELGGSDPFIVLADADIGAAVQAGIRSRFQNAGQSCIAAKRFIVAASVFGDFQARFVEGVRSLKVGNPMDRSTDMGPLARRDLLEALEMQVRTSVDAGAVVLCGSSRRDGRGFFFEPTVLTSVQVQMPAACEEVFGPVAALISARDEQDAILQANSSSYGLGSSIWTRDAGRARKLARDIEAGQVFINGMVASDPRLPFGGVKKSGYGRELSEYGIREFVNIQTVWRR